MAENSMGANTTTLEGTVYWKPIAAPLRAVPARSTAAVKDSPFQAMDRPPASATAGTRSQSGPPERPAAGRAST